MSVVLLLVALVFTILALVAVARVRCSDLFFLIKIPIYTFIGFSPVPVLLAAANGEAKRFVLALMAATAGASALMFGALALEKSTKLQQLQQSFDQVLIGGLKKRKPNS